MRQKEPFAFARNLKIFIIVLCVLPLIGIAMLIFLPKQLNGVTAEVLPAAAADFDFDALYAAVKSGSREYDEDVKKAVDGLIGDVAKTMTINAKLVADGDRAIFVAPYNTGESGYVGIKLYIFKISYAHYEENEFGKAFSVLPDASKLAPLSEGEHYGMMTVTVSAPEELDFCYNYLDGVLSDPVGGSSETVIRRIELDLAEDSTTVRLKKTLFIIAEADTEGNGLITTDSLKTVSRRNVGGFSDFDVTDLATKKIRYAYSGESEEKGAYFTLTLSSGVEDLSKFSVGIVNAEADRYDETPSYPAFYLNMKIFYDQAK